MRRLALVAVLVGCGDAPAAAPPPSPPAVEPASPAVPSRPTRVEWVDAYPLFVDDHLQSCTEMFGRLEQPAGVTEEAERRLMDRSSIELPADITEHRRVDQTCETTTRREPLATCTKERVTNGERGTATLGTRELVYDFGLVFVSDQLMSDCLREGGSWEVVERDSTAALDAERRHLAREGEQIRDRLGRRLR